MGTDPKGIGNSPAFELMKLSESFAVRLQRLQQQSAETDSRVSATIATAKELKTRLELIDIKYPEQ